MTRGRGSWASSGMLLLDVQVNDFLRVFLDVLPARFDGLPHEDREERVGGSGLLDRDLFQDSSRGIHRGLPEFIRVHLAQALLALVRHPLAAEAPPELCHLPRLVAVADFLALL